MFTLLCRHCPESFSSGSISDAMAARRFHEEQRHHEAPVETDMSSSNK